MRLRLNVTMPKENTVTHLGKSGMITNDHMNFWIKERERDNSYTGLRSFLGNKPRTSGTHAPIAQKLCSHNLMGFMPEN